MPHTFSFCHYNKQNKKQKKTKKKKKEKVLKAKKWWSVKGENGTMGYKLSMPITRVKVTVKVIFYWNILNLFSVVTSNLFIFDFFLYCDGPGEGSSEKNCCWGLMFQEQERSHLQSPVNSVCQAMMSYENRSLVTDYSTNHPTTGLHTKSPLWWDEHN